MAKWGEGDPRWIVEDRPDATNVNNWHWTEKNASDWSKKKFDELLVGLSIDFPQLSLSRDPPGDQSKSSSGANDSRTTGYHCKITEVARADGDASANNRKAKLIFFFEWNLELKFEVDKRRKIDNEAEKFDNDDNNDEKYTGSIEIPNLSDENTADEIDLSIKCDQSTDEAYAIKELIRKNLAPKIKKALGQYISDLKHEYGQNLILPTTAKAPSAASAEKSIASKSIVDDNDRRKLVETKNHPKKVDSASNEREKMDNLGLNTPNFDTRDLSLTETFYCAPSDLYRAFVDPQMIQAFTRCPCEVEQPIGNEQQGGGGRFQLYNGHVTGRFLEQRPNESIKMYWRMKTYPADHYSTVNLIFKQQNDSSTVLKLEQRRIPADLYDNTEDGWKRHYFEAMRQTFGFGARIF